jgi:hypothetical protein
MSELILLGVAFFMICFGSLILKRTIDFGFAVADKLLENSGRIIKAPFKVAFKLIGLGIKFILKKSGKKDYYTVRPVPTITPLELQQMRNNQLRSAGIQSVEIEYIQPSNILPKKGN